jgi:hypothetical protein
MKVQVISFSYDRKRAEIVIKGNGHSKTYHVVRERGEKYHWRQKNAAGKEIYHAVYDI